MLMFGKQLTNLSDISFTINKLSQKNKKLKENDIRYLERLVANLKFIRKHFKSEQSKYTHITNNRFTINKQTQHIHTTYFASPKSNNAT